MLSSLLLPRGFYQGLTTTLQGDSQTNTKLLRIARGFYQVDVQGRVDVALFAFMVGSAM